MADVRGMVELGAAANNLANTFGNLPNYDIKQQQQANQLSDLQTTAADKTAEEQWQQEAANRDDFGTADYADAHAKFLQTAGASSAAITRAQLAAQALTHQENLSDVTQSYVQDELEKRVAQTLGMEYYRDKLEQTRQDMIKGGMSAAEADARTRENAIGYGKDVMGKMGIVVNIDHKTGRILAKDKAGNVVPIHPDIAAQAYGMLGQTAPWKQMAAQQAAGMAVDRMYGTAAFGGTATAPSMDAVMAVRQIPLLEKEWSAARAGMTKNAEAAYKQAKTEGRNDDEAQSEYDKAIARGQKHVDDLYAQLKAAHAAAQNHGPEVVAAAASTTAPGNINSDQAHALMSGQPTGTVPNPAAPPVAASPISTAQAAPQQDLRATAAQAAQFLKSLHLDRDNLNTPQVQAYIATLPPQIQAALRDLLDHAAQVYSADNSARAYSQAVGPGIPQ